MWTNMPPLQVMPYHCAGSCPVGMLVLPWLTRLHPWWSISWLASCWLAACWPLCLRATCILDAPLCTALAGSCMHAGWRAVQHPHQQEQMRVLLLPCSRSAQGTECHAARYGRAQHATQGASATGCGGGTLRHGREGGIRYALRSLPLRVRNLTAMVLCSTHR